MASAPPNIRHLRSGDLPVFRQLNQLFAACFEDEKNYQSAPPSDAYLEGLLAKDSVIAIVALEDQQVVQVLEFVIAFK